jgi:hypothetical protein
LSEESRSYEQIIGMTSGLWEVGETFSYLVDEQTSFDRLRCLGIHDAQWVMNKDLVIKSALKVKAKLDPDILPPGVGPIYLYVQHSKAKHFQKCRALHVHLPTLVHVQHIRLPANPHSWSRVGFRELSWSYPNRKTHCLSWS